MGGGGGGGGDSCFSRSWISSSSSRLGMNTPHLVETPDALHNLVSQCLNFFAVGPHRFVTAMVLWGS